MFFSSSSFAFICPFLRSVIANASEDLAIVMVLMTFSSVLLGRVTSTPTSILMCLSFGWRIVRRSRVERQEKMKKEKQTKATKQLEELHSSKSQSLVITKDRWLVK